MRKTSDRTLAKIGSVEGIILDDDMEEEQKCVELKKKLKEIIPDNLQASSEEKKLVSRNNTLLGKGPLHLAAERNLCQVIMLLAKKYGLFVDGPDFERKTPLHIAASNGFFELIGILCSFGANPFAIDSLEQTPIDYAVKYPACLRRLYICSTIISQSPFDFLETLAEFEDDSSNKCLFPILIQGILKNNWKLVNTLIELGASLKQKDKKGNSPLHYAAKMQSPVMLLLICTYLDNLNGQNANGDTALHICVRLAIHHPFSQEELTPEDLNVLNCIKVFFTTEKMINPYIRNAKGKTADDFLKDMKDTRKASIIREAFKPSKSVRNKNIDMHPIKNSKIRHDKEYRSLELHKLVHIDTEKMLNISFIMFPDAKAEKVKEFKWDFYEKMNLNAKTLDNESKKNGSLSQETMKLPIRELAKNFPVSAKLLSSLQHICIGYKSRLGFKIHTKTIYLQTLGLLQYYLPEAILHALTLILPIFKKNNNMANPFAISHILVKNILLLAPEFGFNLFEDTFQSLFKKYVENHCLTKTAEILMGMYEKLRECSLNPDYLQYRQDLTFTNQYEKFCFDNAIHGIILDSGSIDLKVVELLASEISKINIMLYKNFDLGVFSRKPEFFLRYNTLMEKLIAYTRFTILSYQLSYRTKAITLFILIAKACFHLKDSPDVESSLAILVGINDTLLEFNVNQLDENTHSMLLDLKSFLYSKKSLQTFKQRHPSALIPKDIIHEAIRMFESAKPQFEILMEMGKHLDVYLQLKKRLEFYQFACNTRFIEFLINFDPPKLDNTEKMSMPNDTLRAKSSRDRIHRSLRGKNQYFVAAQEITPAENQTPSSLQGTKNGHG